MASLFTKIIKGEIPCHKILEDENYFSFLDIRPIRPGHALVIPKKETDYIYDLSDEELGGLMLFSRKVAAAVLRLCNADGEQGRRCRGRDAIQPPGRGPEP